MYFHACFPDDDRLKPSRTLLYVVAAVAISVLLASCLMFFLYPRSFTIYQNIGADFCGPKLYPYDLYINTVGKSRFSMLIDCLVTRVLEAEVEVIGETQ